MQRFKYICFDADDTLWVNEPYYKESEEKFATMLREYMSSQMVSEELYLTEMQNLTLYGYGAKSFILSMVETALRVSRNNIPGSVISNIIDLGKEQLNKPVVLLEGVLEVLENLSGAGIKLVVATKGDLLDQERKLEKSGIGRFFHHVEIMSDKKESDYLKLLRNLAIDPSEFMMVGNSLKSDILPPIKIGGHAVYVPYHTTWNHEQADMPEGLPNFKQIETIKDLIRVLKYEKD